MRCARFRACACMDRSTSGAARASAWPASTSAAMTTARWAAVLNDYHNIALRNGEDDYRNVRFAPPAAFEVPGEVGRLLRALA